MATTNRVFLNEKGFIEVDINGAQSAQALANIPPEVATMSKKLRAKKKLVCVLADFSDMVRTNIESNRIGLKAIQSLDFDFMALFTEDWYFLHLIRLIVIASGKVDSVRHFESRQEAEDWLRRMALRKTLQ